MNAYNSMVSTVVAAKINPAITAVNMWLYLLSKTPAYKHYVHTTINRMN